MPHADLAAAADSRYSWIVAFAVLVAVAVAIGLWVEHKRKQRIRKFAALRGLTYIPRDDQWKDIDTGRPYREGHSHKIVNVLTGQHNGRPIVIYENQWTTGHGKEANRHVMTKVLIGLPKSFSRLEVAPEGLFGRAARRLGIKDIELESDEFNRAYRVAGDRRFAYDVLHPRFMQWMLDVDAPGFVINGRYIAIGMSGKLDLLRVDGYLAYLNDAVDQLPRYIVG